MRKLLSHLLKSNLFLLFYFFKRRRRRYSFKFYDCSFIESSLFSTIILFLWFSKILTLLFGWWLFDSKIKLLSSCQEILENNTRVKKVLSRIFYLRFSILRWFLCFQTLWRFLRLLFLGCNWHTIENKVFIVWCICAEAWGELLCSVMNLISFISMIRWSFLFSLSRSMIFSYWSVRRLNKCLCVWNLLKFSKHSFFYLFLKHAFCLASRTVHQNYNWLWRFCCMRMLNVNTILNNWFSFIWRIAT